MSKRNLTSNYPLLLVYISFSFSSAKINITENVTWHSVIEPLEKLNRKLEYGWGVVSHLNGVQNSEELRAAYQEVK